MNGSVCTQNIGSKQQLQVWTTVFCWTNYSNKEVGQEKVCIWKNLIEKLR